MTATQTPINAHRFSTLAEVRAANKAAGYNFFARDTMRYFRSRVESKLYGGRYFITSERASVQPSRRYTVRRANDDGSIDTVGDFQAYVHIDDARERCRILARFDVLNDTYGRDLTPP